MAMIVKQILAQKPVTGVVTISASAPVAEAVRIMAERRIGALIVSDDGRRVDGILSERDVVRELARRGGAILTEEVGSMMTRRVKGCTPGQTAEEVLQAMTDGRFRHMPVLIDGTLAGVISIGDVVKARIDEMAMEKSALEEMIKGF
jgi:CBS domain-containing protein